MIYLYIASLILAFIITAVSLRFLIPALKSRKMGQKILDIGPRWHKSKEGTPTMGGLSFLITAILLTALFFPFILKKYESGSLTPVIITALMALLNGLIGIIDDRAKLVKKQNEGLKAWQKYFLQLAVCALYLLAMSRAGLISTSMYIPFFKTDIELGIAYYFFSIILITGTVNSVNLADGIDGLAASEGAVIAAFFSASAFVMGSLSVSLLSGLLLGICLGFLVYNFYPARVFMGDTGSLFLGGFIIGLAYLINNPLIIIVIGIMYLIESLSVILQVGYFRITHGKRLFKMSPIHHHFEKCGWSEIKIVSVFSSITLIMCIIAFIFEIAA